MANFKRKKGVIAILTGGGDVPGLNPAIRAITIRATMEGYQVLGIRRGWAGTIGIIRDKEADNSNHCVTLTEEIVNKCGYKREDSIANVAMLTAWLREEPAGQDLSEPFVSQNSGKKKSVISASSPPLPHICNGHAVGGRVHS